ncbi:MAG: hypothetical protein V4760_19680 [Bdellovibrionota bacterium]
MGRLAVVLGLGALFISFQNFSNVPLAVLQPQLSTAYARAVSPTDGRADMRELAPPKPADEDDSVIAVPQSGNDLESVGQDWMTRQTNAITGGAEQKILDKMNRKMNRWVNGPDAGTPKREPGSVTGVPRTERVASERTDSVRPKNVRFSRVNKMDMDLAGDTHLSCQYKGNSVQWDLTRNVVGDVDLNIRHDSRDSANSIHLKYNW